MWPFKKKGGSSGSSASVKPEVHPGHHQAHSSHPASQPAESHVESRVVRMNTNLHESFHRVREDMNNVNSWLSFFYSQMLENQNSIETLQAQLAQQSRQISQLSTEVKSQPEQPDVEGILVRLRKAEKKVDELGLSVHSVEPLISRISELNSKVKLVEDAQKSETEKLRHLNSRVESVSQPSAKRAMNLREKIVRKVARHSKEYIKNLILSTINKYDQISGLQLREMIVEEQGLCSKSTFYRLLEELEAEERASMMSRGKEKIYTPKAIERHSMK